MMLHCGDCAKILPSIPSESVDMVLTSPPYDNLRSYNGYSFDFATIARELVRVLKPGSIMVWVSSDATVNGSETGTSFNQVLYFMSAGLSLHDTMIWLKPDPTPQQQHPRYQPSFEYMFVFCKGCNPKTFNPIKVPTKYGGTSTSIMGQRNKSTDSHRHPDGKRYTVKHEKLKPNVWTIGKERVKGHPAPFPIQLALDHIKSWSNPGDIVLDPFMGSGTTGLAAKQLEREFIGIEISSEYFTLCQQRLGMEAIA